MNKQPLVSLILVVENGMPYIKQAIRSVQQQTYGNIELIVQDGKSTDGTLEFLQNLTGIKNIQIKSEPDNSQADGWNRALKRCKGQIIGSIDADNILKREALEIITKLFKKNPQVAAIYGTSKLIDNYGKVIQKGRGKEVVKPFNLIRLMRCELVPPFASSFFDAILCKEKLYCDERMETCWDFDLWLRLSDLPITATGSVLSYTRRHQNSSTCRPENYEKFCLNKIYALKKYLSRFPQDKPLMALYQFSVAGIYTWAAESIYGLEGTSRRFNYFGKKALFFDAYSERISQLKLYAQNNAPL